MRRTGLFGISKEDLLEWIRNSNYCDNDKLAEVIGGDNINKEKDAKYNLIDIINGSPIGNVTDGAVTDTNKVYKTFEELPKDIILDVNAGNKNGVEWLIGKYKRYYSKKRKQALFDLDLKKDGEVVKLIESIKHFCQQFANYEEIKNFIDGVGKENEERSSKGRKKRLNVFFGVLIVLLGLGISSLLYNLIKGVENEVTQILATVCGILDFICGIVFFIDEKREDEEEKEREEKISNAQSELFNAVRSAKAAAMLSEEAARLTSKLGDTLSNTTDKLNSTLDSTLRQTSTINENLNDTINKTSKANTELGTILKKLTKKTEKAKKKLEIERENLRICEQCHVPLENYCNVCGHRNDPSMTITTIDRYWQQTNSDDDGWKVIKNEPYNEFTIIFYKKEVTLDSECRNIFSDNVQDKPGLATIGYVKKILFTNMVNNITIKDDLLTIKGIFQNVQLVAFAKPNCDQYGNVSKQYELGENIFAFLQNSIKVKGLEYIKSAGKGCFAGWKDYCMSVGLQFDHTCFECG